jgi:hypothetical protein
VQDDAAGGGSGSAGDGDKAAAGKAGATSGTPPFPVPAADLEKAPAN